MRLVAFKCLNEFFIFSKGRHLFNNSSVSSIRGRTFFPLQMLSCYTHSYSNLLSFIDIIFFSLFRFFWNSLEEKLSNLEDENHVLRQKALAVTPRSIRASIAKPFIDVSTICSSNYKTDVLNVKFPFHITAQDIYIH